MLVYLCHQVVECWKDQRCQDVLHHNPTYESSKLLLIPEVVSIMLISKYLLDFFEFGDSCYGSGIKSCFISSKVKCEITQQSVKNSFGGREKVVGFDLENHKIVIPPSSDQQTYFELSNSPESFWTKFLPKKVKAVPLKGKIMILTNSRLVFWWIRVYFCSLKIFRIRA